MIIFLASVHISILFSANFQPIWIANGGAFLFIFVTFVRILYSTLLHLPFLRFHCVGGCSDRLLRLWHWQSDAETARLDLIHNSTISHKSVWFVISVSVFTKPGFIHDCILTRRLDCTRIIVALYWFISFDSVLLAQSRQSGKLFSSRRNWDPLTRRRVCPPSLGGGVTHSLAGEGVGRGQFRRGDRHCCTLVYVLYVLDHHSGLFLTNVTLECETACNKLFGKYKIKFDRVEYL